MKVACTLEKSNTVLANHMTILEEISSSRHEETILLSCYTMSKRENALKSFKKNCMFRGLK